MPTAQTWEANHIHIDNCMGDGTYLMVKRMYGIFINVITCNNVQFTQIFEIEATNWMH